MIKLLIGGSPCTFWSIAQKNERETKPQGLGWELFKNFLIAKEKFKPDFFLYENNKSASQAIKDQISRELGVELMYINSALVSAQNRERFYVFNWEVEQPEDRGLLLLDILESGVVDREKAYCLKQHCGTARDYIKKSCNQVAFEPVRIGNIGSNSQAHRVYSCDGKTVTLSANGGGQGGKTGLYLVPITETNFYALSDEYYKGGFNGNLIGMTKNGEGKYRNGKQPSQQYRIYSCECKSQVLNTLANENYIVPVNDKDIQPCYEVKNGFITFQGGQYPINLADGFYVIRKLTVKESCRAQTLPDDYCRVVSPTQAYKGLGNGWTAEVIIHILNGALKDVPKDEEVIVLSMYDGIGTGRYCLDKMGFTNVKYFAYEIDKYAKQVSMSNYPDIIQMGDAFDLRHPDWTIGY